MLSPNMFFLHSQIEWSKHGLDSNGCGRRRKWRGPLIDVGDGGSGSRVVDGNAEELRDKGVGLQEVAVGRVYGYHVRAILKYITYVLVRP